MPNRQSRKRRPSPNVAAGGLLARSGPESLEKRQLLSIAPLITPEERRAVAALAAERDTAAVASTSRSLVVIDAGAYGDGSIAGSFDDAVATLVVGQSEDVFAKVEDTLSRVADISAIHLVSHGSPGRFTLGSTRFDVDGVDVLGPSLVAWNRLTRPGADLYLWGCDIAGGDGASLVDSLYATSGFGIAASTDVTGPAALGGDFDLEYVVGEVAAPWLAAGVDVLWDTSLTDHTFTTASKTAMQSAFDALNDSVAPEISTALAGRTTATTVDNLAQRTINNLFTDSTSISPTDVQTLLELKSAASTYFTSAGANASLSGLAAAINTAIAAKATAAGAAAGARTITVTPSVSGNLVSLQVSITATGTKQATVDMGTDALPSTWNRVIQTLNSDYGAVFRTSPLLETGTTLTTGFTITLDLTNAGSPTASLAIATTNLAGGIYSVGPGIRFGILDATIGGQPTLPYSSTVSFGPDGPSRLVADWGTPAASASALGTPSATIDLPITASIGTVPVTSSTTKLRIVSADTTGVLPPTVTGIDLGRLVWFGNLTSDDLINAVKRVGGAYEVLGTSEALTASIPFVQRTSLLDVFAFDTLFDEGIASVVDVSVPTLMPTEAGSGLTFTVTAGGTQLTLSGDRRSDISVGQSIGLVPTTPTALDGVIRTVTAVTLSGGNTLVSIDATIDGTTTSGSLVATTPVRPDNLQTLADFQNYPAFAALGITPVYDAVNGTVSIQVATSRSAPVSGQLANDSAISFTYGGTTYEVTVAKAAAANNANFAALVADFNAALATARQVVNNVPAASTVDISSSYSFSGTLGRLTLTHTGTSTAVLSGLPVPNLLATPAVAFNAAPLGAVSFTSGAAAGTTDVKLAFGVQFDIGPGSPIVIGLGSQPVGNGRLPADTTVTFTSGNDTWEVTVKAADTTTNGSFADLVADLNAARTTAQKLVDGTPETNADRTAKLTDISSLFEFFSESAGNVSVRTTGGSPTTVLSNQAIATLTRGRLSADAVFAVTAVGSTSTTVTVSQSSTSTNESIDDLVVDVNAALSSAGVTVVSARKDSAGTGIELFTPTVNSSMPIGIKITAARTQGNEDLGISDGLPSTVTDDITLFGRPSGVSSRVVPHTDPTKKFAETTLDWQLNGLSGTVAYGINTVAFGTTTGDVDATYSAVLASAGGSADDIIVGTPGLLTSAFTGSGSLALRTLSRVGAATNDISSTAAITIAVTDLTAEMIDSFVDIGAVLAVSGLEDSGRGTGKLSADSKVRFTAGSDTYEVTVTPASAANNATFADLVTDFNQALSAARKIINNNPDLSQTYNLTGQFSFSGSGGRVSVLRFQSGVWYPVLENLLVPNLAAGGGQTGRLTTSSSLSVIRGSDTYTVTVPAAVTSSNATFADLVADFNAAFVTARRQLPVQSVPNLATNGATNGRLSADASLEISRGVDTYTVTVLAVNTVANATFADLVADFNAALQTAQKQTDTGPVTVDARGLLEFSPGQTSGQLQVASIEDASGLLRFVATGTAGRVQPQSLQEIANPSYATVTVPQPSDMGDIGYQAGLSVQSIAGALADAARAFDVLERDLKEYTEQEIPLVGQSLADLITLNAGLEGRIQAFGKLSASSPQELERALETSLGVPSSDLRVSYDSVRKAYRIDFAYRASKLATVAFDVDMGVYYALLGKPMPKGIDSLTDGDAKTPLSVVVNSTSVLSVGYDLRDEKTFLYGHDGSSDHGVTNGTSFEITFTVNGQNLQFPAKFGLDVRNGTAQLQNGKLVVELDGQTFEKSFTAAGNTLVLGSTSGLAAGMTVTGNGIPSGTVISQVANSTQVLISNAATASSGTATFRAANSSRFDVFPDAGSSQLDALTVDNYSATFSGQVRAIMPIFDAFARANLTVQSQQDMLASVDNPTLLANHPASFYLSMPDLGGYLDAVSRLEEARDAVLALTSAQKTVDDKGVQLGDEADRLGVFGSAEYQRWRASWKGRLQTAAEDLGGVLFAFAPELENTRNLLGAQESLVDYIRDPAMILDKLNAAIGGVESALKGLDKIPLPFMEGKLGGAVSSIFSFRTGWLLDMRNKMRGAGEGIFDVMRQSVFEYLGPKHANILLKYDPVSMDRSLDSMVAATRPEDIGVVFMDKNREVLSNDVRGADAFEIVFRLGQKVFDTGIDLGFKLDALQNIGIGASFDGGLRLQVGWEMLLGFGFSIADGFYVKVDSSGDAGSRGNFSGSTGQFEAQLRFDATLTGASKNYTQRWDAGGNYWKIVDTKGTTVTTDDADVIDALTGQPYRAIAVNNRATDVTALVSTDPAVYDPCGCGEQPSATSQGQKVWWVVGTDSGNGSFVPAELNDQGMYVPQTSPYAHTLIEVTAMKPAQLAGSLFFLRLAATDKIRRGLSGFTDVDSQYFYDASNGPQVTAEQRDDEATGVNRNNELPTRFSAAVGLNMADPSAKANRFTVRESSGAPAGAGTRRVVDPFGQVVQGDSGAIAKPGRAWSLSPLFWKASEIPGVYAKEYYEYKLKVAPPAKYAALDFPVRVASDGNIALRGMGIIDGVQLKVGDRVLVKGQALAEENGIYTVSPGGWSRSFDANDNADFNTGSGKPIFVLVEGGRANKNTGWNLRDDTGNVTLGTTPLYFERTMVSVREMLVAGAYTFRLVPYQPFITLPILASLIDQSAGDSLNIQVEYNQQNYIITLDTSSGGTGPALRAAQLNMALAQARPAQLNAKGEVEAVPNNSSTYNLAQAGFTFVTPGSDAKKWYRIEFARLKEVNGVVSRHTDRVGTFVDYGVPDALETIGTAKGWDPIADINADASPGRITWREFRSAGPKNIFQVDFHADAVANLTMDLSIADKSSSVNLTIPRIFADFNLDWSTRAARARIEQAKQAATDQAASSSQSQSTQPSDDGVSVSLVKRVQEEEGVEKAAEKTIGGDKGINPASPLLKEMDLKPEIGFNNIRLDVGSFLTKFLKPSIDQAEPYLKQVRPVLQFFNSRIPVLSDVAGRTIRVVDLLEAYGGPKGKTVRAVIDVVTAIDNLVARIAALPPGVNIQIPMGRFWFPKEFIQQSATAGQTAPPGLAYKYGSMVYDNLALGKRASGYYGGTSAAAQANADAKAAIDALTAANPNSDQQKKKQGFLSNNAADRGGIRVPLLEDPLNLFQLMMGKTATLVTYQLPKLQYEFEQDIPLLKIICFEVGLRASFEMNSNLAFGFDTYGINQYMASGDIADIAQGFYVSDRANADGTGADIPEFQAIASFGLYGGIDLVLAKGGIEGGLRFVGEVNLNDPNNDGKLRFTEAVGLVADTGNPLDLFDLSLRGEVYARYYYKVGLGKLAIKGGKTFARIQLFNLVYEGSDGTPIYASRIDSSEGDAVPGTLLIHVGEAAPKRVSNQDPLNAKDGAERYKIWSSGGTVFVQYLNYSQSITKSWSGVKVVLFEGGLGDDSLDASGLNDIPLIFKGGDGNDSVTLGSGHASTVSRIDGEDGNDTIIVNGGGVVELVGGVGNDIITGGTGLVRIEAGEGSDTITTRAGSTSTLVMAEDYGLDNATLATTALQNLLDFTSLASAIEFLLDAALGSTVDGTAKAGAKNVLTFNVGGVTEIRGSSQDDTFTARNPRTRNASRASFGVRLFRGSEFQDLPEIAVPNLAADGSTTWRLAADSAMAIDIGNYTYTVTVPKTTADNNTSISDLVQDFNSARATASRQDRTNPTALPTVVDATNLLFFLAPTTDVLAGLLLRGGQGDDLYDLTLDSVGSMGSDGIVIDDVQAVVPAMAGTVETCGTCREVKSIAVSSSGKGYELPPEVMIIDPTGSGAKATAVIDEQGRVTAIQVIEGGSGYTSPTALLIAPRSLNDKLVISSTRSAATLSDPQVNSGRTTYKYAVDGKTVRFVGWGDARRPAGIDQSEIDSVTVNMPEGVLTLDSRINLFQTFTVNTSRMVQNAQVIADTIDIETDHGFQVKYPLHAVNSGDVRLRVTGDGSNTGEGSDLNAVANRATATAVVSAGGVAGLTVGTAGSKYFFTPSITVGADGVTPGTGARFAATLAGNGGGLSGFTQLSPGSGYYTSPAPIVVVPPPASIQVDSMITSSTPNNPGLGDGRGRVMLFADTGMVSTSSEVFFPVDTRPGTPQGARTIDWIGGDFRYRSMVGLDDIVSPTMYPGVSVGTGAEFTAVLDADGRVTGFTQVSGGSGYSADLPPLIEIEGLATAVVGTYGANGSIGTLRVTYPGDGYGQPPRVTIKPNGFGRIVTSPNGIGSGMSADGTTPMNRVHIRSIGGTLVAVAGAGVGDPLKPIKSDVEKLVAQVTTAGGGVHVLEKDGLRIGKDQSVSGITTINGDVSITTFGGALELGAPRQAVDEQGRLLWQDAAKTIPIYDRDPVTNQIIYEGGNITVGSGDVKLTADDVEVNVPLGQSNGSGTITLQPVNMKAEIGLAGTRARVQGTVTSDGKLVFQTVGNQNLLVPVAGSFWGGRGYQTAPLVIVDPAGQRAFASAVVEAGKVTAIDVLFGGTNYDPNDPPFVSISGGGINNATPANQANAVAIVGDDGVITGFQVLGGSDERGRLSADSKIRFTQGTTTYEVTVLQSSAATNNTFADLVTDLQAALASARQVTNGTPSVQTYNIASQFQFEAGTLGRIGLRYTGTSPATQILQNYLVPNLASIGGSGYVTAPQVSIASPGQALVQAVLDTSNPDPVTGRFSVKEFVVTNAGRNYTTAPIIEVAAPYDFTLDADEVTQFAGQFAQVVIGRIEGQHLFHSPQGSFQGNVVLRAPRAGGALDVASFTTTGPVSIVGSGSTFHFDSTNASISGTSISIDDNVIVHEGVSGTATASTGPIVIFGTGKGMIDGDPNGDDVGDNEDLLLTAATTITVTGGIGSRWKLDDLTVTSQNRGDIDLQQSVSLTGDLSITGGAVTVGGIVQVAGDLVVDASAMVLFSANVSVGGNLIITGGSGVTFAGSLTVGGSVSIAQVPGAVRFGAMVTTTGPIDVSAGTLIEVLSGLVSGGNATFTANDLEFKGGIASVTTSAGGTLTVKPTSASRPIRVGTPLGSNSGTLDVSDADLAAIASGWTGVVLGDATAGTGAVTIGSIGTQQGSKNSWLANSATIVGGSVVVTQKVDSAAGAGSLTLVARTGDVTVNAAINETAAERNAWLRMEAAQAIALNAPIWSSQQVSIVSGTTTGQTAAAPITTSGLRVSAGGAVTLGSFGNFFDTLAVATTDDTILVRELTGYAIGTVDGVSGITVGTATATLVSEGQVTQTQPISAGTLDLQGAGGEWTLLAANTIGTLTADTGRVIVADAAGLTVGSLRATKQDYPAIDLYAPGGLTLTGPITTTGGHVTLNNAVTLAADLVIDVEDAGAVGRVNFLGSIDGTTTGQQSLTVTGNLRSDGSIGSAFALESLSVSRDSTLGRNGTGALVRTVGGQTFTGQADSDGILTVQAGAAAAVRFLGNVSLSGLVTATADTAAYDVLLTGSTVAITNAVTFANTGSVTLGDASTDDLHFAGGLTSTEPSTTNLAGTIRTTNANAEFGRTPGGVIALTADTTVSTGNGDATFSGTVDAATSGGSALTVNADGTTSFAQAVGGTRALKSLATSGGGTTRINGGSVTTSGTAGQVYGDAVSLGATTVLNALAGAITFGSTLDGSNSLPVNLTVNTSGITTFGDGVGSSAALASLTTDAAGTTVLDGNHITTSGPGGQSFNDAVTLGNNTLLDAGAGPIGFSSTVDGTCHLWVNTTGTTTFGGAVGGGTPLAALTTSSGGMTVINGGLVATNAALGQVFNDAVRLGATTTLSAAAGAVTLANTVDGGYRLVVNTAGDTSFLGAVGSLESLAHVETDAPGRTIVSGGSIRTAGPASQLYADPVLLGANAVFTALNAANITFGGTLDGTFSATVNTNGITKFAGAVGGATPLASLQTGAGGATRLEGGAITTTGSNGTFFGNHVALGADVVISTGTGPITFDRMLDGGFALVANSTGQTTFNAAVGDNIPLASLATNAGGTVIIAGGLVGTVGNQAWRDDVVSLSSDTLLRSSAGAIVAGTTTTFQAAGRTVDFRAGSGIGASVAPMAPAAAPIRIAAASVTGRVTGSGDINIIGLGDLVIGAAGLTAPGTMWIDAWQQIRVPDGGTIVAAGGVTAGKPVHWSVLSAAGDAGPGSLRQVSTNANVSGVEGRVVFPAGPTLFAVQSQLPTITTRLTIDGTGAGVTIDGRGTIAAGLTLAAASAGSTIRGVTVRNFADNGIVLEGSAGSTVQGCVIQANGNGLRAAGTLTGTTVTGNTFTANANYGIQLYGARGLWVDGNSVRGVNTSTSMGLYATGDLAGTRVTANTFSGGLRGALLDGARNLAFGQIGRGNTLTENVAAPTDPTFSGTGIRAQGNLAGTVVAGNTFTNNNIGFGFVNAQNLVLRQNSFTRNRGTAIYVEGNCVGSSQTRNVFGTGVNKNKATISRLRGSRGI